MVTVLIVSVGLAEVSSSEVEVEMTESGSDSVRPVWVAGESRDWMDRSRVRSPG